MLFLTKVQKNLWLAVISRNLLKQGPKSKNTTVRQRWHVTCSIDPCRKLLYQSSGSDWFKTFAILLCRKSWKWSELDPGNPTTAASFSGMRAGLFHFLTQKNPRNAWAFLFKGSDWLIAVRSCLLSKILFRDLAIAAGNQIAFPKDIDHIFSLPIHKCCISHNHSNALIIG